MAESEKFDCKNQAGHQMHICQLKKKGLVKEVAARTDDVGFICHNCNAIANQAVDLCNPSSFIKRT